MINMRIRLLYIALILSVILILVAFLEPTWLLAGQGVDAELSLLQPIGARAIAMGEACVAGQDSVLGFYYTPAQNLPDKQAAMQYNTGIMDDSLSALGIGIPFSFGTIGVNALYYNGGSIELNSSEGVQTNVNAETDITGIVSYSKTIREATFGISVKYFSSKLVDQFSASSIMFDIGMKYRFNQNWSAGFSGQNLNGKVKYIDRTDKLLSIIRTGVAYSYKQVIAEVDSVTIKDNRKIGFNLGAEYHVANPLFIRAGYRIGYDEASYSAGFGLVIKQKYVIDYAFVPYTGLSASTHKVSLLVHF